MALAEHIPVTLLPSFLGAGKSTLLNELLSDPAFHGTALVINEFGDVAVDHLLVPQVKLPKRLDLAQDAERAVDGVSGLIVANWVESTF